MLRSVLTEAAIVGFVSSAVGVGLGVAAAIGLKALLGGFGASLPSGSLTFEPRTAIVGLAVGTLVTVVSAIGPARNAVRIPPVAALTDRATDGARASLSKRRLIAGAALALLGVLLLGLGLSKPVVALVGVGAVCIFVGVAMIAPAIARPLSDLLGRPLAALLGTPGWLGRENSMRSPSRTAQTASALMVGLALVSAMAVFGASYSESATSSVDQAISADLLISANGTGQLSDSVPATVATVPGVTTTNTVYRDQFEFKSTLTTLTGVTTQNLADTVTVRMTVGVDRRPGPGRAAHRLHDRDEGSPGGRRHGAGPVRVHGADHHPDRRDLPVQRLGPELPGQLHVLPRPLQAPHPGAVLVSTNGAPGVETAVTQALAPYADVQVQTRAQFEQSQVSRSTSCSA